MIDYAAIVKTVDLLSRKNSVPPCKKKLQKIIFLIESKSADLGCDYGIHYYGPYSSDLDFAVRKLNDDGILRVDYTHTEHRISVIDQTLAREYKNKRIEKIIEETADAFSKDTPSNLELIATALYVYFGIKDIEKIKSNVKKIKGNKYSDVQIDAAIEKLKAFGYLPK